MLYEFCEFLQSLFLIKGEKSMEKLEIIIATLMVLKEAGEEISDWFSVSISEEFYSALDKITFLTNKSLGLSGNGTITDATSTLGEATCGIGNLIVWGILLYYCFCSLFQYFLSREVEIPWKVFIRSIIFGILINSSFFICYQAVYFAENITLYISEYCGGKTSFSYMETFSDELDLETDEGLEEISIFSMNELIKVSAYFMTFVMSVTLGGRFIIIKALIILSPILLAFGCSKLTEKILTKSGKLFLKLLGYQIVVVIVLEIFNNLSFSGDAILEILFISTMLVAIKFAKKIC